MKFTTLVKATRLQLAAALRSAVAPSSGRAYDVRTPLLRLSDRDVWTVRDSFEGTQIFGATGSGKTSGSGATLARAFLKAGYGGLVLTVKREEAGQWRQWLAEVGRSADLLHVTLEGDRQFNFLEYEAQRPGGGRTENIVQLFLNVSEIQDRQSGGGTNEGYWRKTLEQLVRNTVELLRLAGEAVTLTALYQVILSAPTERRLAEDAGFLRQSRCGQLLTAALERAEAARLDRSAEQDLALTGEYWLKEYPQLSEKTRSIIVSNFTSLIDGLQRGSWRRLFSSGTNFYPEDTLAGKIVLLDMPVKVEHQTGLYAQMVLKYVFQQAWERRLMTEASRPVFLWADEAQYFLTGYDREFLTTARSSRIATVFLTQNLSNYYAGLRGKGDVKAEVDALLGNLSTKIFHSNSDKVTNEWAAETIGKSWQLRTSINEGHSGTGQGLSLRPERLVAQPQVSRSMSPDLSYRVLPQEFMRLKKGGPEAAFRVEGVVLQSGRVWRANGLNFLRVHFTQRRQP